MNVEESPAFQLYAGRLLSHPQVALMDATEVGIFFRLYLHAWISRDGLPSDARSLAALACCTTREFRVAWDRVIAPCFVARPDGRLVFPDHEETRRYQEERREARSRAGKRGARRTWLGDEPDTALPLSENGKAILNKTANNGSVTVTVAVERDSNESLPEQVEPFFRTWLGTVAAANATKRISEGRATSLRRELAAKCGILGADAIVHGLREATMREKPVLGYVLACAKGFVPEPAAAPRHLRAVAAAGSLGDVPATIPADQRL